MTASPLSTEISEPRSVTGSGLEHRRPTAEAGPVRHGAQLGVARILLSPAAEELCRAFVGRERLTRYAFADASVASRATPVIDDDGLLWWGGSWVAIPDAQVPLARRLVADFQDCVLDEDIASVYPSPAGPAGSKVVAGALRRLGSRLAACGLTLRRIRGRGYILDRASGPVS
jgi:hypothetical protein